MGVNTLRIGLIPHGVLSRTLPSKMAGNNKETTRKQTIKLNRSYTTCQNHANQNMVHAATPVNNWCVLLRYFSIYSLYMYIQVYTYILIIINHYITLHGQPVFVVGLFYALLGIHLSCDLDWKAAPPFSHFWFEMLDAQLGFHPQIGFSTWKFLFPNSQSNRDASALVLVDVCPLPWAFASLCLGGVHPPLTCSFVPSGFWFSCIRLHKSLLACLLIVAQTTWYFCFLSLLHMTIMWCCMLAHSLRESFFNQAAVIILDFMFDRLAKQSVKRRVRKFQGLAELF